MQNARKNITVFATIACLGLAGCGDTAVEQALLGAGAGASAATIAGTSVSNAALIGATANLVYCQKYPSKC